MTNLSALNSLPARAEKVSDTFCAKHPEGPFRQKVSDTFSAGATGRSARDWELALQTGRTPQDPAEQKEFVRFLCRQLEAVTINITMQAARQSTPKNTLLSGGLAGSMFQGMADEEFSRLIAAGGGFGVGDAIFRQITYGPEALRAYAPAAGNALSSNPPKVR